jgi:hypothetical protein
MYVCRCVQMSDRLEARLSARLEQLLADKLEASFAAWSLSATSAATTRK